MRNEKEIKTKIYDLAVTSQVTGSKAAKVKAQIEILKWVLGE